MRHFRFTYLRKFLSLFLTVAILNVVVDPPDSLRNLDADLELEEDLSLNEMESVFEVFVEKGLDIENAIPETDDQESEDLCKKVEIVEFLELEVAEFMKASLPISIVHKTSFVDYFSVVSLLIDSPPPRI